MLVEAATLRLCDAHVVLVFNQRDAFDHGGADMSDADVDDAAVSSQQYDAAHFPTSSCSGRRRLGVVRY